MQKNSENALVTAVEVYQNEQEGKRERGGRGRGRAVQPSG